VSVLIDLQRVSMTEPDKVLFDELSLTVSTGDRLGVVGINGTGKSTLLRVMAGLVTPDGGDIRRGSGARTIFLGQVPDLAGSSVREAIGPGWEAEAALDRLGMSSHINRSVSELSGGQAKRVALADIVISTALIPGRAAPTLITEEMVKSMKPGSVIVDIAAGKGPNGGGNCPLSEADKTVVKHGVTLIGETNLPALVAADASALYARNVLDFLKLLITKEGTLNIDMNDDIVAACLMTQNGDVKRK
jgi:NAD(P) transhydrogenase subunit alpha